MEQFFFQTSRVTGQRALFGAWSLWFFVFLMMPISTMYYGTVESSMLFVSANVALWLGLLLPFHSMRGSQVSVPRRFAERDIGRILASLVAAGALAIPAKLIDLIVYRDILSATSFADARSKIEANGSNLVSTLYFGLSPAIMMGGIVALSLLRDGRHKRVSVAALLLFCINPMFSFVNGGRSTLFMIAGLAVITWLLVVPAVSRRQLLAFLGLLLVVFFITMYLFVSRSVEAVGAEVDFLAHASAYTELVPINVDTLSTMRDLPELGRFLLYYVLSVGQYVVHGVFEFFYLVQAKSPNEPFLWGRYEFTLYDQAQRLITGRGSPPVDLEVYNPTSGLFSTFWGPAYIDFGYLMIIYGFFFGYITGCVRKVVEQGDLFALPLYVLLVLQIFLVPIVNGILMASAIVLDVGLFGIWLLTRLYLGKSKIGGGVAAFQTSG